jgi:hypothetical protein
MLWIARSVKIGKNHDDASALNAYIMLYLQKLRQTMLTIIPQTFRRQKVTGVCRCWAITVWSTTCTDPLPDQA